MEEITFQMIQKEFDLVTNAIYTEPHDKTTWCKDTTSTTTANNTIHQMMYYTQIIQLRIQQIRELQTETNNTSKWVLIG
jgi:hypothetical protein